MAELFLKKIEAAGFSATDKRQDPESQRFLRKQAKTMIAAFLPHALTYE
ncbi:MAG: hypothetical protein AAF438_13115 [Pseudomonadota bacterium]